MTRYREILRLDSLGESPGTISNAVSCNESTVRRVLKVCSNAGLSWPLPDTMDDELIRRIIYPEKYGKRGDYLEPDYVWVHEQLKAKGVTRSLLYEEYCDKCRSAKRNFCSVTTFNNGYEQWTRSQNLTMHIERKPAQKMEVDWAGTKMHLIDRDTGEIIDVPIFVACLPFSGKLYAEGFLSMDSECWLTAHVHALDFYGGVPQEIVPDNCKTAVVSHPRKSDPIINRAYADLAEHYGCAIVPARVRKPKDKANVEAGVGIITRRAIAALRNRTFFTLGELNAALMEKVTQVNNAEFTRKPGSRASIFDTQERQELAPLPKLAFPVRTWERATVRSDYHVKVKSSYYSVPFEYIGKVVDACVTQTTVEIFFADVRIATHLKSLTEGSYSTAKEHMPQNHADYLEWNIEGLAKRARSIGPACERALSIVVSTQENAKKSIGQGKSLLALANRYGSAILEEACLKVIDAGDGHVCSLEALECICKATYKAKGDVEDSGAHALLRGADYYSRERR